jgi:hypothetical protein
MQPHCPAKGAGEGKNVEPICPVSRGGGNMGFQAPWGGGGNAQKVPGGGEVRSLVVALREMEFNMESPWARIGRG